MSYSSLIRKSKILQLEVILDGIYDTIQYLEATHKGSWDFQTIKQVLAQNGKIPVGFSPERYTAALLAVSNGNINRVSLALN